MIDLHTHTNYSDGTDTVKELLKKANKRNLSVISITDHNLCTAYEEMKTFNVSDYFEGNIIVGCEFTTSFNNRLIEVLGYGFDYKIVDEYMSKFYTNDFDSESNFKIHVRLIKKVIEFGFKCDFDKVEIKKGVGLGIYNELIKYPENKEILKEDIFSSFSDFYRKGLTNPNSKLFINYTEFKPQLKDIIDLIHNSGGIVFLAHPYQYKMEDTEKFLDKLYDEYDFDGIECFYTTFSKEQTDYLLNFAKKRNLLISGGSDYHALNKENHELGIGRGNLNINKEILNNWNIKYYK